MDDPAEVARQWIASEAKLKARIAELESQMDELISYSDGIYLQLITAQRQLESERERCAKLCEKLSLPRDTEWWQALDDCAAAIRALGDE